MEYRQNQPAANHIDYDVDASKFDNEAVSLGEAVSREWPQNILDALAQLDPVGRALWRVTYVPPGHGPSIDALTALLGQGLDHLKALGLAEPIESGEEPDLLVLEDFGTPGLTGSVDTLDDGNFTNYVRRLGRSDKGGTCGGRAGVGKLTAPMASRLRTSFIYTERIDDGRKLFMGLSVLQSHELRGQRYMPHGFIAQFREDGLALPIEDEAELRRLRAMLSISREDGEPGLSIVIPYPNI
jgi:hypothetical protein